MFNNNNGVKAGYSKFYEYLNPYYVIKDPKDRTLLFESRFECGNLQRVYKMYLMLSNEFSGKYEYDLYCKYDHGTSNYTQWYFFRV
jgi:hypothetical protein